jgi:hypothetical protein
MANCQTKNQNLGYILEGFAICRRCGIFMSNWYFYSNFVPIFCGHLLYFMDIWYIFPRFGMLQQKNLATPVTSRRQIALLGSILVIRTENVKKIFWPFREASGLTWVPEMKLNELFRW